MLQLKQTKKYILGLIMQIFLNTIEKELEYKYKKELNNLHFLRDMRTIKIIKSNIKTMKKEFNDKNSTVNKELEKAILGIIKDKKYIDVFFNDNLEYFSYFVDFYKRENQDRFNILAYELVKRIIAKNSIKIEIKIERFFYGT